MAVPGRHTSGIARGITGVVLAGGEGNRMGGADKGLVPLAGRAMIEHTIAALAPQVGQLVLSANRNLDTYRAYGYPVVSDGEAGYQGPLAGIAAGLAHATSEFVAFVPCDAPAVPSDLVARLQAAVDEADAEVAAAFDGQRLHPAHSLVRAELHHDATASLAAGERRIAYWFRTRRLVQVDFSDNPEAFSNVNTPEERDRLEARLV